MSTRAATLGTMLAASLAGSAFALAAPTPPEFVFVSGTRSVSANSWIQCFDSDKCDPGSLLYVEETLSTDYPGDFDAVVHLNQYGMDMTSSQFSSIAPSTIVASGGVSATVFPYPDYEPLGPSTTSVCKVTFDLTSAAVVSMSGTLVVEDTFAQSCGFNPSQALFKATCSLSSVGGLVPPLATSVTGISYACVITKIDDPLEFSLVAVLPPGLYQFQTGTSGVMYYEYAGGKSQFDVKLSIVGAPADFGDINGDAAIDSADLALLLAAWGTGDAAADLDNNGLVNGRDLGILLAYWSPASPG